MGYIGVGDVSESITIEEWRITWDFDMEREGEEDYCKRDWELHCWKGQGVLTVWMHAVKITHYHVVKLIPKMIRNSTTIVIWYDHDFIKCDSTYGTYLHLKNKIFQSITKFRSIYGYLSGTLMKSSSPYWSKPVLTPDSSLWLSFSF